MIGGPVGKALGPRVPDRTIQIVRRSPGSRIPPECPAIPGGNFRKNLDLVAKLGELAAAKGCTPGQLALAWVLAQGEDIAPIPREAPVDHSSDAVVVVLTPLIDH
jgi:aryl-alcohol dehydrogenase-like predicted oxidoreductase